MPRRLLPHSLRQLVLLAFVLVLLPLLILAYLGYRSLNNLSNQAAEINRTTLSDVRHSEGMMGTALEMERSYRQYCVLNDEALKTLYQNQHKQYQKMLQEQHIVQPDSPQYQKLNQLMLQLNTPACENGVPEKGTGTLLESFSYANSTLVQATREVIYSRGQELQYDIAKRGQFFGWQTLLLVFLSLLLIALFTRMIIGPVKMIEQMINRLGEGRRLDPRIFKGPKELRSLAQRIIWLSERLAWLESQRHEFLRHISHELKTPLASMREGTELLVDQVVGPLTAEQHEVVEILSSSSRDLQQLIEQLLDYNRRLSDRPAEKQHILLSEIVEGVIAAHSLPARSKAMKTECQLLQQECLAEPALLSSVMDNLYSNAVHYGAQSGTIWIKSCQKGAILEIEVANSGEPIPHSEQNMIFEPFYQGSHQRKGAVKGSGLGLSIARDCIRRMQGELRLVAVEYADVCFRIELPNQSET
ncbi:MAG: HAMP domain-containing sensor histidine kinase [Enterobacteriaceae bacterium]